MPDTIDSIAYDTIVDYAPLVGTVFEATETFLKFTGYLTEDRSLEHALAAVRAQLQKVMQQLGEVNVRLNDLARQVARIDNRTRLDKLSECARTVDAWAFELSQKPDDPSARARIAHGLGVQAERFLDDFDMWLWTDIRITVRKDEYGRRLTPLIEALAPDFKTHAALPLYLDTMMAWLAAIDFHTGGAQALVADTYGAQLRRHIDRAVNRPGWTETQPPATFPEEVRARISCYPVAQHTYAERDGRCAITIVCNNVIDRDVTEVGEAVVYMQMPSPSATVLCTFSPDLGATQEADIEAKYGVDAFRQLEQGLTRVLTTGSLRVTDYPRFSTTPYVQPVWLYAVQPDGTLLWFRKDGAAAWQGPKQVAAGWTRFTDVIAAGGNRFFGITADGVLKWCQHEGFNDGSVSWQGPIDVGSGWIFRRIFAGSDGVLYAVRDDGNLLWYRYDGQAMDGSAAWSGPKTVGWGWHTFKDVISTGGGKIYAVTPEGQLWLYEHDGFTTGAATWKTYQLPDRVGSPERRLVGSGWQGFKKILPVADGVLLALTDDGRLLSYKHLGYVVIEPTHPAGAARVEERWEGPVELGTGWGAFPRIFAALPASVRGPR